MKKFVALLLSTLTIIATLFALSGCSSKKDGKTKKEWIEYAVKKEFTVMIRSENLAYYYEDPYTEFEFDFKKIKKYSKYVTPLVYDPVTKKMRSGERTAYLLEFYRYSKREIVEPYGGLCIIGVEDCNHCNNFLRAGENKKYCEDCVIKITYNYSYLEFKDNAKETN